MLAGALLTSAPLGGCASGDPDFVPTVTYAPCGASVAVDVGASQDQIRSVDAALALWNETAGFGLARIETPDPRAVPLRFETAAPLFRGLYDDDQGIVYINAQLADPHRRMITIAHELGHAFGLLHVPEDERASLMNPQNQTLGPTREDVAMVYETWGACDR